MRWRGVVIAAVVLLAVGAAGAYEPRRRHRRRPPPDAGDVAVMAANQRWTETARIALPGLGLTLAWSPDGTRLAVGGRFRERETGLRYDTRIADVAAARLVKSYACHYYHVVATAWAITPHQGEVVADGGADHAVKLWDAAGPGSRRCRPGQLRSEDGGLRALPEINGWTTALAFSPDGRYLAGASRDRMIRIWDLAPGPSQYRVIRVLYDAEATSFATVAWVAGGLVTGDRQGNVVEWALDPDLDRWSEATITEFARLWYEAQPGWCLRHAEHVQAPVRWRAQGRGWAWNVRPSPDGARVAAVRGGGTLTVYERDGGGIAFRRTAERPTPLHGLDWSPDGRWIATGGADGAIHVFDAASGEPIDRLEGHGDVVTAVAWSPDGARLASTAGGARISTALLAVFTGPDQAIRVWSPR